MQYRGYRAALSLARGRQTEALNRCQGLVAEAAARGLPWLVQVREAWVDGVEAALLVGARDRAEAILSLLAAHEKQLIAPYLRAQRTRFQARLGLGGSPEKVAGLFTEAEAGFAGIGYPYWLARTRLDHAEWLMSVGHPAEGRRLAAAATLFFANYGARTWQERAERLNRANPRTGKVGR